MPHTASIISIRNSMLFILVFQFTFSTAQDTIKYFKGLPDATMDEIIELTAAESVGNSTSNPYAKYIFGLPPIPIDPAIKGVESDDDFETLAPFTPEQVYHKHWFISGFDKENRPILVQALPRVGKAFYNLFSNSSALKLFSKLARYRQYILLKALKIRSTKIKPVTQYVKINDFINSNSYGPIFTNLAGLKWFIHRIATDRQFLEKYEKTEIVLNGETFVIAVVVLIIGIVLRAKNFKNLKAGFVNTIIYFAVAILVGVVGEAIARIAGRAAARRRRPQVYGPDKSTWQRALQRQFPRDQLPEEYGGLRGQVPIKLYPD